MNAAAVDQIARAILYEGYLLYPYRASSVKNRQRWTFGGLYPPAFSQAQGGSDPSELVTECLVLGGPDATLSIRVRFLHLLQRSVEESTGSPQAETRQEAVERETEAAGVSLGELLGGSRTSSFSFSGSQEREPCPSSGDAAPAAVLRRQEALTGLLEVSALPLGRSGEEGQDLFKIRVRVANTTSLVNAEQANRDEAQLRSLTSTHVVLGVQHGAFVSLMDPPETCRQAAAGCHNVGVWPILVGAEGDRDTLLASPIILYDYPQIAPESPGDLFDGTEIDEILTLRILTMTESEKQEVHAGDARGRELLARTEALAREQLLGLHGTFRGLRPVDRDGPGEAPCPLAPSFGGWPEDRPRLECVHVGPLEIRPGDRVRLRPGGRADIFDRALEGMTATVQSIEQDFEDRIFLSVTVDDDPGKDLGAQGKPGHRFFFRPTEVESLSAEEQRP